jgi:hypothetical protein
MFLIAKATFPRSSVPQAAKAFTQLSKLPATVTRQGPYFHFDDNNNIQTTSLYSFSSSPIGHEEKKFVENRLKVFSGVPGFSCTIENWLSMEEAILRVKNNE